MIATKQIQPGVNGQVLKTSGGIPGWEDQFGGVGAANRVTYWSGANALASDAKFLWNPSTSVLTVDGTQEFKGIAAPAASGAGDGRIYFDSSTNKFKVSENGGGYTDLLTGGTVTSVGLSLPSEITVTGSPVTSSGTLTGSWADQNANEVFAGPASGPAGTPSFRALVAADLPAGTGTVTSVALSMPAELTVTGSPVTTSGTLAATWADANQNYVFAGPATGGAGTPTFRALVTADLPAGTGTVTSVALSLPAEFTISGSPVTTSGTLTGAWADAAQNAVFAGPSTGGAGTPAFRALVAADIPAHATTHQSGGSDAIKLDDLALPDDNTDLDATTSYHGLLPKLGGGTTNFLRADGTWAAPSGGATPGGADTNVQFNNAGSFGGSANLTWNGSTLYVNGKLTVTGNIDPKALLLDGASDEVYIEWAAGDAVAVAGAGKARIRYNDTTKAFEWSADGGIWQEFGTASSSSSSSSGPSGTPGGPNTSIQFNDNGSFGGSSKLAWDGSKVYLSGSLEWGGIAAPAVSAAGAGKIYFDSSSNKFRFSENGGAYADFGTVTSVALSLPAEITVSGSPVTTSGTLTGSWADAAQNAVFAGPSTGGAGTPAFRALVAADIPAHASTHQSGGSDAIKLDDLAAPDDNTDLDATTSVHGLLPKLGGGTTNFLRADGSWAAPPSGSVGGADTNVQFNNAGAFDGDAEFTWDTSTKALRITGTVNCIKSGAGANNTYYGVNAGSANAGAVRNVIIGDSAAPTGGSSFEDNVVMGYQAGNGLGAGCARNVLLGTQAGLTLTSNAVDNVYVGYQAGASANTGDDGNTCVGYQAGYQIDNAGNSMFGYQAGLNNIGPYNVFMGYQAGYMQGVDFSNYTVGIGYRVMYSADSGVDYSVIIGFEAGYDLTGNNNVILGANSMSAATSASGNTCAGFSSGDGITTGSNNVFAGSGAGGVAVGSGSQNVGVGQNTFQCTGTGSAVLGSGNATNNTAVHNYSVIAGYASMRSAGTKTDAIAIGRNTGDAFATITGAIGIGYYALNAIQTSSYTIGIGYQAFELLTGTGNTGVGYHVGSNLVAHNNNTIMGYDACGESGAATSSVIIGFEAARGTSSHTKTESIIIGYRADYFGSSTNRTTYRCVFIGNEAGYAATQTSTTDRQYDVGIGYQSLYNSNDCDQNTALGAFSGYSITTGGLNTLIGYYAGYEIVSTTNQVAIGMNAQRSTGANFAVVIGSGDGGTTYANPYASAQGAVAIGAGTIVTVADMVSIGARGMIWENRSSPGVSAAGTGRIYYDTSENKFKVSENGGAYEDLVIGPTSPGGADTNIQFNNGGVFGGSADLTWNGLTLYVNGKLTVTGNIDPKALLLAGASNEVYMEFDSGHDVAEAGVGKGRLRYNSQKLQFEASMDGSEWMPFGPAASSSSSSSGLGQITDARKYTKVIGDAASTSFNVAHNLGTEDVVVQIWETGGNRELVTADVTVINDDVVQVTFASPPTAGEFMAVVVG